MPDPLHIWRSSLEETVMIKKDISWNPQSLKPPTHRRESWTRYKSVAFLGNLAQRLRPLFGFWPGLHSHTHTYTHTHSHPSRLPPPLLESVWASHSGVFITFTQVHPYLSPRAALIALTMCPTGNLSHLLMRDPHCAQGRYLENAVFKEMPITAISQWEISYWLMRKIHNNEFDMVTHS